MIDRRSLIRALALTIVLLPFVGCGGGVKEEVTELPQISPAEVLKNTLQSVAQTGEDLGSGAENIQQLIDELRKTDAAKADALAADFKELASARDANSRKKAAKKMLEKL